VGEWVLLPAGVPTQRADSLLLLDVCAWLWVRERCGRDPSFCDKIGHPRFRNVGVLRWDVPTVKVDDDDLIHRLCVRVKKSSGGTEDRMAC
jgi:hypothetical protein